MSLDDLRRRDVLRAQRQAISDLHDPGGANAFPHLAERQLRGFATADVENVLAVSGIDDQMPRHFGSSCSTPANRRSSPESDRVLDDSTCLVASRSVPAPQAIFLANAYKLHCKELCGTLLLQRNL
jgi:hypothetical protein